MISQDLNIAHHNQITITLSHYSKNITLSALSSISNPSAEY